MCVPPPIGGGRFRIHLRGLSRAGPSLYDAARGGAVRPGARRRLRVVAVSLVAAAAFAPPAAADDWLPHPADASWTWEWSDTVYNPTPTKERVTVKEQSARAFTLAWTTLDLGNPPESPASVGTVSFQESAAGLINTDWSSGPPPPTFPILCAVQSPCNNSLASTYYLLIWGARAPVIAAPVVAGTAWSARGGASGEVSSENEYVGVEAISVPAFPAPVRAAKLRSDVSQAGAIGDPYGSGVRTVWWVYGVGPVKIVFEHAGSDGAVTTSTLVSTNQTAKPPPPDTVWLPFTQGEKLRYRWSNTKHMPKPSVQELTVDAVVNGSARFTVKHVSGPIRVAGGYGFTSRSDGITSLWSTTRSATLAPLPPLGPASLPKGKRRRFVTPFDFLTFGFNPVLPAYAAPGAAWGSRVPSRDYAVFGVTGTSRVTGFASVRVPFGSYRALVVRSELRQQGFPFGSGTRTAYFAPGKGLVKLVYRHGDGSVSTVERTK